MDIISFQILMAYIIGTLVGIFISRNRAINEANELIGSLVDEGFLRSFKDADGNVVITKWHDNRKQK